jgi:hypothetical protein
LINSPQDPPASFSDDAADITSVEGPRSAQEQALLKTDTASGLTANTSDISWVVAVWRRLRREPSLMVTVAYLFVSFIGLWSNYWFYRRFDLPILEYMQASDYLVAGLRDPVYAFLLLSSLLLVLLVSWPDSFRRRHPERVDAHRRTWWGRLVFSNFRGMGWKGIGLAHETGIVFAVFWGVVWASATYVAGKAQDIHEGRTGHAVRVTLAGESAPLPQTARLLGSSSAFVFLWWPQQRVAEAVPIESIGRLQSVARSAGATKELGASGAASSRPPPATSAD